jgi:hypothetical protein
MCAFNFSVFFATSIFMVQKAKAKAKDYGHYQGFSRGHPP